MLYLLEVVTGIRSGVDVHRAVDDRQRARRSTTPARPAASLPAGDGGSTGHADRDPSRQRADRAANLRRRRPNACCRSTRSGCSPPKRPTHADIKLQNAKATFSQGGYPIVTSAIDGNSTAEADNGWAIAPQLGRDHIGEVRPGDAARRREGPDPRAVDPPELRRRPAFARPVPHLGDRRGPAAQLRLAGRRSPRFSPSRPTSGPMPTAQALLGAAPQGRQAVSRSCRPSWPPQQQPLPDDPRVESSSKPSWPPPSSRCRWIRSCSSFAAPSR